MPVSDSRRVQNVGTDARARAGRKGLGVEASIGARRGVVPLEVGARVASEAGLRFEPAAGLCALGCVAYEHAEALGLSR